MRGRLTVSRWALISLVWVLLAGCTLAADVAPTPAPTPDIPQAEFLAPPNSATIYEGAELTVDILARDTTTGIAQIAFLVDDVVLLTAEPENGAVTDFRVETNWFASGVGLHLLTIIAYRPDGTQSLPTDILVEVLPRP